MHETDQRQRNGLPKRAKRFVFSNGSSGKYSIRSNVLCRNKQRFSVIPFFRRLRGCLPSECFFCFVSRNDEIFSSTPRGKKRSNRVECIGRTQKNLTYYHVILASARQWKRGWVRRVARTKKAVQGAIRMWSDGRDGRYEKRRLVFLFLTKKLLVSRYPGCCLGRRTEV